MSRIVNDSIEIGEKRIGLNEPVFIVAETGINHNGEREIAEKLIEKAYEAGADAVKFQTYVTEKRVPNNSEIFSILKKCELSQEDQRKLKAIADDLGIVFFSTAFDKESVDFLLELKIPVFKIASFDIVNLDLLRYIAKNHVPTIMSRGMADQTEIEQAIKINRKYNTPYILLHCISAYPAPANEANLKVIETLRSSYDCPIGFSDHTIGTLVPMLAVAAGAKVIEKHFTLDSTQKGPDHSLSADPQVFKEMVDNIRKAEQVLGDNMLKVYECERGTLQYRRSPK